MAKSHPTKCLAIYSNTFVSVNSPYPNGPTDSYHAHISRIFIKNNRNSPGISRIFIKNNRNSPGISCVFIKNSRNTPSISRVFIKNSRNSPGISCVFIKNGWDTPVSRVFSSKTVEIHPYLACFYQKQAIIIPRRGSLRPVGVRIKFGTTQNGLK